LLARAVKKVNSGLKNSRSLLEKKKSVSAFQAEHFSKRKLLANKQ
jgi:hypothetical protein